jgi:hypothetical protein
MPSYTLNALINNQGSSLQVNYNQALTLWDSIWNDPKSETVEGLSEILTSKQLTFENNCGGRYVGQEVMVWSGFASLYDPISGYQEGNEDKSRRLYEAFKESYCSGEVISEARKAAKSYYLD